MFESCRAHSRVSHTRRKLRVVGNLCPYISKGDTIRGAGDAAYPLSLERQLVTGLRSARDLQHAQAPVHLAAVVLARNRLLAGIATLAEADVRLLEPGFGGKDAVVELVTPARNARLDAPAFDIFLARLVARRPLVEHFVPAEDEPRLVLLRLDLDLGGEACACELRPHDLPELGLGQEEEIVLRAPPHTEWSDDARLR